MGYFNDSEQAEQKTHMSFYLLFEKFTIKIFIRKFC